MSDILNNPTFLEIFNTAKSRIQAKLMADELKIDNKETAEAVLEIYLIWNNKENTKEMIEAYSFAEDYSRNYKETLEPSSSGAKQMDWNIESGHKELSIINQAIKYVPYAKRQTYREDLSIHKQQLTSNMQKLTTTYI